MKKNLMRLLIGGTMSVFIFGFVVLFMVFMAFAPLPFIRPLWHTSVLDFRSNMAGSVSNQVIGLSQDEVRGMLGAPSNVSLVDDVVWSTTISYRLNRRQHLVISFNQNDIAAWVGVGNPAHFGLGG
ncbi:MAG: outer membrane protein assembly factor BamE [Defluviitaleaceae bacterium]|nr:outer membrane protein assembly factor BamE [Defluviitaleaceae bacterium]